MIGSWTFCSFIYLTQPFLPFLQEDSALYYYGECRLWLHPQCWALGIVCFCQVAYTDRHSILSLLLLQPGDGSLVFHALRSSCSRFNFWLGFQAKLVEYGFYKQWIASNTTLVWILWKVCVCVCAEVNWLHEGLKESVCRKLPTVVNSCASKKVFIHVINRSNN